MWKLDKGKGYEERWKKLLWERVRKGKRFIGIELPKILMANISKNVVMLVITVKKKNIKFDL